MARAANGMQPERLRKRADFLKTMNGARLRGPFFLLAVKANGLDTARIGYTVTKKQGNAVKRNRIRRRLRALMHDHAAQIIPGHDYVVTASADVLNAAPATLKAEVVRRLASATRNVRRTTPDTGPDTSVGPVAALTEGMPEPTSDPIANTLADPIPGAHASRIPASQTDRTDNGQ